MISKPVQAALAAGVILAISAANIAAEDYDLPVVPAKVLNKKGSPSAQSAQSEFTASVNSNPTLTMKPGINQIIPIATGHPNRIVTPFSTPEVVSTSLTGMDASGACGEVCIKENVVYVATDKAHPVTMFITEKGSQAQALSLTMVPKRIPPREVFLKMKDGLVNGSYGSFAGNSKAASWEKSQPYIQTIRSVFRSAALGEIPPSYNIGKVPKGAVLPSCNAPGISVNFSDGQFMSGHSINVFVGVAVNNSHQPIEIKEAWCGAWDVAAVAMWPRNVLGPGEKTEVFVAKKQNRTKPAASKRPSLL